jgi:predicted nucleic acid-binding protein
MGAMHSLEATDRAAFGQTAPKTASRCRSVCGQRGSGEVAALPDAIIQATARVHHLPRATRNTKDFQADEPGVTVPYRLP